MFLAAVGASVQAAAGFQAAAGSSFLAGGGSSGTASQVYPGLAGFLVVAGMGVAVYFLFRSLNKQLKKISPDGPGTPGRPGRPRGGAPRPGLQAHRAAARAIGGDAAGRLGGQPDDGTGVSRPDGPAGT